MDTYQPTEDDLPMAVDQAQDEDLPLDMNQYAETKARPVSVENMLRQHAAVLQADVEDVSVFEAYESLDPTTDPKLMVNQLAAKRSQNEQKSLKEYFEQNLGNSPEQIAENIGYYQELSEEEARRGTPERQVIESMVGEVFPEPAEMDEMEAELMVINTLTDLVENYTGFEKAIDLAKMFLPTTIIDNVQLTGKAFNAEDYLRDVVIGLKDMRRNDPEKFAKVFPGIVKEFEENLPKGKQIALLSSLIDPRGEEETKFFGNLDAALDIVDIVPTGIGVAMTAARMTRKANTIRLAKKMENSDMAVDINTANLIDETGDIAAKTGVEKETSYSNAAPFNVSALDETYTSGLSAKSLDRINKVKEHQRQVSDVLRSDKILKEGLLDTAERTAAEEAFSADMATKGLENIQVVNRGPAETTFSYDMFDPALGEKVGKTQTLGLTLDHKTGVWRNTEENMLGNFATSPTVFANPALDAVEAAIRMDTTSAPVAKMFKTLQTQALRPILGGFGQSLNPIRRKELAELDAVLLAGDEFRSVNGRRGKVYTAKELRAGVVDGVPLNDRQIEAYYNLRGLYDEMFTIRNTATRDALVAQGYKEVRVSDTVPAAIGKNYDQAGAVGLINSSGLVRVYDTVSNTVVTLRGRDVKNIYDTGRTINKLKDPIPTSAKGDLYDLIISPSSSVRDLPEKVLHFKEGYVPKVNKNANWFVKATGNRTINGQVHTGQILKTERMFASRTEAERWAAAQGRPELKVYHDREVEQQILGEQQIGAGGGLYTGARSSEDIPYGADGVPLERMNTYEALGFSLNSLERYVTRNQWRMGVEQKWINSAKAAGFNVTKFDKNLIPEGNPKGVGLRRLADQIEVWSGFPSRSELMWDGVVSSVMEWALNSRFVPLKDKHVVRGANFLKASDPVKNIRAGAFHSLLGVFNPAQMFVQAQGAALAFSLHPLTALDAIRLQSALIITSRLGDNTGAISKIGKVLGIPEKEAVHLTAMWNKSGFQDSVTNTADHAAAARGFGVTADAVKRAADKSLLFYRAGELFNRRYSFATAAIEFGKKKGTFKFTDDELKEVINTANRTMLNPSKSNAAAWQRGPLAVPTQFFQIQAKMMETMFGFNKAFTGRERARIMIGQLALYGAAGVPLANIGIRGAMEFFGKTQADVEELPKEVVEAMNNGFWGVYFNTILGADVDVSNRGAIATGMTEFFLDLALSDSPVYEKVMGAGGMLPHRVFKAWKDIKPMVLSESDQPITGEEIKIGMRALASVTSTWNNYEKGRFMHNMQTLIDTRGNAIVKDHKFDDQTVWFTMLGFQPSELRRTRDREGLVRSRKEHRAQITTSLVNHYWSYLRAYQGADNEAEQEQLVERYAAGTKVLMASLRNEGERQKVREALNAKLTDPSDKKTKAIKQFLEEFADGQVLAWGSLIAASKAQGLIQNTETEE